MWGEMLGVVMTIAGMTVGENAGTIHAITQRCYQQLFFV